MDDEAQALARTAAGIVKRAPSWALVVAFAILAVVFALLGQLDDWARVVLAVTFGVITVALIGRLFGERSSSPPL
jgi:uncharacterized membrane protein YjjP (DUF1212 family)